VVFATMLMVHVHAFQVSMEQNVIYKQQYFKLLKCYFAF